MHRFSKIPYSIPYCVYEMKFDERIVSNHLSISNMWKFAEEIVSNDLESLCFSKIRYFNFELLRKENRVHLSILHIWNKVKGSRESFDFEYMKVWRENRVLRFRGHASLFQNTIFQFCASKKRFDIWRKNRVQLFRFWMYKSLLRKSCPTI